jgi:serine/threonine protein phosphatase Stp1
VTCESVRAAIDAANAAIIAENARTGGQSGATIVALRIDGATADIYWAGDSRAYRIRAGRAEQISHDHSVVQDLVDAGLIAAEDAERHPRAHVVTRALGVSATIDIAQRCVDVAPGDRFLLCSDGFSRSLPLADLAREVLRAGQTGRDLLRRAVERDGSDNVSFVLVTVGG